MHQLYSPWRGWESGVKLARPQLAVGCQRRGKPHNSTEGLPPCSLPERGLSLHSGGWNRAIWIHPEFQVKAPAQPPQERGRPWVLCNTCVWLKSVRAGLPWEWLADIEDINGYQPVEIMNKDSHFPIDIKERYLWQSIHLFLNYISYRATSVFIRYLDIATSAYL